jgi:hypothetical protein
LSSKKQSCLDPETSTTDINPETSTTDINQKVTEKIAEIQGGKPAEVHGSDFTIPNEIKSIQVWVLAKLLVPMG